MVIGVVGAGGQPSGSAIGFDFDDPALEADLGATLAEMESIIRVAVTSTDPLVSEAARHLVDAGGKRFRPLLVALAAHFGDPNAPGVALAGAVVELTHLATLYHDDVMDEAAMRRGAPSANARWGNSVAILIGDYLFARAADCATELGIDAVRIQSKTFARLVHGQIAETVGPGPDDDQIEHYLQVVVQKTGSLIAASTRMGAMFAGASTEQIDRLADYGEMIGIAFQLSDDLLDITSDRSQSGKTPGTDLREGVLTLPVLYALEAGDDSAGARRLREILADGAVTDDALHAEALELLRASAAMKRARETVRSYAERARLTLTDLPPVPARSALASLCDYIGDRTG
jgi:heptaprenyl diphosphate synthase